MTRSRLGAALCAVWLAAGAAAAAQRGAGAPTIVVETSRGTFEIETYPDDAPRTVAHVVDLVRRKFYDGQHVHRAVPDFVIQWGDPQTRGRANEADWGRGRAASSGHPVGVAEITKRRTPTRGAVALAHPGNPADGDSQIFVTLADRPDLNGRYAVFGHVVSGESVVARIQRGDEITRMFVRE